MKTLRTREYYYKVYIAGGAANLQKKVEMMEMNLKPKPQQNVSSDHLMNLIKNQGLNFNRIMNTNNVPNVPQNFPIPIQIPQTNNPNQKVEDINKMINLAVQYENVSQSRNNLMLNSIGNANNIMSDEKKTNEETISNPEKRKELISNLSTYFDEIRKQIGSMQQNSNIQSFLIANIFKNMETFFEQISSNNPSKINPSMFQPENLQQQLNMGNMKPNMNLEGYPQNTNMSSSLPFNVSSTINQTNFPMNHEQLMYSSNNYGLNNFNQIFQNNLNLFPPNGPMGLPLSMMNVPSINNVPQNFGDPAMFNQMLNPSMMNRMPLPFNMVPQMSMNNSSNYNFLGQNNHKS